MQIAFGKLQEFDFFPHGGRACLFGGRFICFWTIRCFFSNVSAVFNEIFKMFIPIICCLYSNNLFGYNSLNMLTLLSCSLYVTGKGKSLNLSHYVTPTKLRSHRSSGPVWEITFTLVFTCFFSDKLAKLNLQYNILVPKKVTFTQNKRNWS